MSQNLLHTIRDAASAYVLGTIDAEALEETLAKLAIPVSEGNDPSTQDLHALIWLLLSEYDLGHRDEASLRRSLQQAIPARRAS
jgi:hypothetical protein